MSRSEKAIQNDGLVALSAEPDSIYWRNNTGKAWQGEKVNAAPGSHVKVEPGMVILRKARFITFGLSGSGDVIGAQQGVPVVVEFKTLTGPQAEQQRLFSAAWRRAGGVYVLARSPEESVLQVRAELATR